MLGGNENYTKNIEYLKDHSIWQVMVVNTQASTLKEKRKTNRVQFKLHNKSWSHHANYRELCKYKCLFN